MLVLLAYSLFKDDVNTALKPAVGIEMFHNFTLMHDDIMDNAPLRRGNATVHEKWNSNIAILSGDVMLVKAYEYMMCCKTELLPQVLTLFNNAATEVCEGQQWDMNFESISNVTVKDYLEMIRLKTAVLLGYSLQIGAAIAQATPEQQKMLYRLGENAGIAFQLKDDLLDAFGDQEKFGKLVGGDIIANKKTYLLIKALEKAEGNTLAELNNWLTAKTFNKAEKVNAVLDIYRKLGIAETTEEIIKTYFDKADEDMKNLEQSGLDISLLKSFMDSLMKRVS